jgi:hypothetical protein
MGLLPQTDIGQGITMPSSPTSTIGNAVPPSIPTQHPYRTLVVCFDGTGDQYVTTKPLCSQFIHCSNRLLFSQVRLGRKDVISFYESQLEDD